MISVTVAPFTLKSSAAIFCKSFH